VLHLLTPERFRGTATALYILLTMLFGYGVGTWLIGFVSDLFASHVGSASIKYALLTVAPAAAVIAAIEFIRAAKTLAADTETARAIAAKA
jgi:MFS family permease